MPAPAVAFAGKFLGAKAPRPPTFLGAIAPRPSGYRHLNRQQIEMTGGGLRVGAVCPPRTPPECFSWFYFACAWFAGSGKSGQIAPFRRVYWLRPQMLEKHTPPEKRGL